MIMAYDTPADNHQGRPVPLTQNAAFRKFRTVVSEHLVLLPWEKENGEPVIATLIDEETGHAFSFSFLDSIDANEPSEYGKAGER